VTVECPAKINTFLAVGPPDERGWHPLRTIFQAIDLCDTLTIEPADTDEVTFSVPGVPARNTVTEALRRLREHCEVAPHRIHIEKRIPAESGLGGGSSDAAGVLRHLGHGLSPQRLMKIALQVGADVPFFLLGGRARAEGYGERLASLPDLPKRWLVLARPDEGCPTAEMFRKLDEKPREFEDFPSGDVLYNDFERVAPCASLDLIEAILANGADDASLTGSGSVVFGRYPDETAARRGAEQMEKLASWLRICSTIVT
jgi:4-diphosphocytidyl-2-C-methyl-D-erythritol kinase